MNRRGFVAVLGALFAAGRAGAKVKDAAKVEKLSLSEDEWRKRLPAERFAVLREEATERSGSSPLLAEHRNGTFVCAIP